MPRQPTLWGLPERGAPAATRRRRRGRTGYGARVACDRGRCRSQWPAGEVKRDGCNETRRRFEQRAGFLRKRRHRSHLHIPKLRAVRRRGPRRSALASRMFRCRAFPASQAKSLGQGPRDRRRPFVAEQEGPLILSIFGLPEWARRLARAPPGGFLWVSIRAAGDVFHPFAMPDSGNRITSYWKATRQGRLTSLPWDASAAAELQLPVAFKNELNS